MPLGLSYPRHEIFRAQIQLAVFTPMDVGERTIYNPAFYFHKVAALSNNNALLLEEEYNSHTDAIPAESMAGYMQQLGQAYDLTGYWIFSY